MEARPEIDQRGTPPGPDGRGPINHDTALALDAALVDRIIDSAGCDFRAFEQLVDRHRGRIAAGCRRITGSAEEAEDLTQEIFAKAYFSLLDFERRSSFRTWLHRIQLNHCLNHVSRSQRHRAVSLTDDHSETTPELITASPERSVHARRDGRHISDTLAEMSNTLSEPLMLRERDGLSYQEIADRLGIGLPATKMRIKRARETFRERYRGIMSPAGPA